MTPFKVRQIGGRRCGLRSQQNCRRVYAEGYKRRDARCPLSTNIYIIDGDTVNLTISFTTTENCNEGNNNRIREQLVYIFNSIPQNIMYNDGMFWCPSFPSTQFATFSSYGL